MDQDEQQNNLVYYRKRMGFTQAYVIRLLGWKNIKGLRLIESRKAHPSLKTALNLAIVYRVPVEFLLKELFLDLRSRMRARETVLAPPGQQTLPLAEATADDLDPISAPSSTNQVKQ